MSKASQASPSVPAPAALGPRLVISNGKRVTPAWEDGNTPRSGARNRSLLFGLTRGLLWGLTFEVVGVALVIGIFYGLKWLTHAGWTFLHTHTL